MNVLKLTIQISLKGQATSITHQTWVIQLLYVWHILKHI